MNNVKKHGVMKRMKHMCECIFEFCIVLRTDENWLGTISWIPEQFILSWTIFLTFYLTVTFLSLWPNRWTKFGSEYSFEIFMECSGA